MERANAEAAAKKQAEERAAAEAAAEAEKAEEAALAQTAAESASDQSPALEKELADATGEAHPGKVCGVPDLLTASLSCCLLMQAPLRILQYLTTADSVVEVVPCGHA